MWRICLAVAVTLALSVPAEAQPAVPLRPAEGLLCRSAVGAAERGAGLPPHLLAAIARIESGRRDPLTGAVHPWPWSVNAEGQGFFYETKAEAIAAVRAMQARGIQSIDVGCGQINLMHHPDAFPSLEVAFDPLANASYAAHFLKELFEQTGDWNKATAMYHSATPEIGAEYQQRVLAAWPEEQRLAGLVGPSPLAQAWAATMSSSSFATTSAPPPLGFMRVVRLQPPGAVQGPHNILLLPAVGGASPPGRGLKAYRATPIALAFQPPPRRGG
jgi:Transglycosylase SLT domain